jgi:hypothetical protein
MRDKNCLIIWTNIEMTYDSTQDPSWSSSQKFCYRNNLLQHNKGHGDHSRVDLILSAGKLKGLPVRQRT